MGKRAKNAYFRRPYSALMARQSYFLPISRTKYTKLGSQKLCKRRSQYAPCLGITRKRRFLGAILRKTKHLKRRALTQPDKYDSLNLYGRFKFYRIFTSKAHRGIFAYARALRRIATKEEAIR